MHCKHISDLLTPSLLIDKKRLLSNIQSMAQKAEDNGVTLRPHIKTHKCIDIAELQRKYGSTGLTVSTLDEAAIFADAGFNDITYAVPITSNNINAALMILDQAELKLLVDSQDTIKILDERCKEFGATVDALLKVDCGYHRCGVNPENYTSIKLVQKIVNSSHLRFKGILTHAGHSYGAQDVAQLKEIAKIEQQVMVNFAHRLKMEDKNLKPEVVSIGSTPTISLTERIMDGITEIRPGNYVFYDYSQLNLGSCGPRDCALTVLASIIGIYEDHLVIDAGATALSKDLGPSEKLSVKQFGKIYSDYETDSFETSLLIESLSQEHGKVKFIDQSSTSMAINSTLRILPNHACLTANLHDYYYILEGSEIVERWQIHRRRPITSTC